MKVQISGDGKLRLIRDGETLTFVFNEAYKGYYPACRWTAAGRGELLYLAGTDQKGLPHLFSSLGGETWTEMNIRTRTGLPDPGAFGDILYILCDEKDRQVFLVTEKGYLVTLPDCPRCVRARRVCDRAPAEVRMDEGYIFLKDESGEEIRIPVSSAIQYRCAWSFAGPFLKDGGLLFDLRSGREQKEMPVPASIRMEMGDLQGLLGRMPRERPIFFFCSHGYLADQAVRDAREAGFERSYSLGGIYDILEDQAGF